MSYKRTLMRTIASLVFGGMLVVLVGAFFEHISSKTILKFTFKRDAREVGMTMWTSICLRPPLRAKLLLKQKLFMSSLTMPFLPL